MVGIALRDVDTEERDVLLAGVHVAIVGAPWGAPGEGDLDRVQVRQPEDLHLSGETSKVGPIGSRR